MTVVDSTDLESEVTGLISGDELIGKVILMFADSTELMAA